MVTYIISKNGIPLFMTHANSKQDAIFNYCEELNAEATDYDVVDPDWTDDLDFVQVSQ